MPMKDDDLSLPLLRQKAEQKLHGQLERLGLLSRQDIQRLVHELGTHEIELEMQNEELRQALIDLEEARNRYADLYNHAPVGYFTFDEKGSIRDVNERGAGLLGIDKSFLINKPFSVFVAGRDRDAFLAHCEAVCETRSAQIIDATVRKKDGVEFIAHFESMAVTAGMDQDVLCRTMLYDITEKKEAERKEAELIGRVFSGVQHELGNPVNSINMLLGVVRDRLKTMPLETIDENLAAVAEQVGRIEKVLRAMKNFNLYETQALRKVQLTDFMENFLPLIRGECGRADLCIDIMLDPAVKALYVDTLALQRILHHVITNAADAVRWRQDPKITLSVSRERGNVRFRVEDNGTGIPRDKMKEIFEPFYTTKENHAGLGLVIVRQMLARMNGSIAVESKADAGTIVDVTFPLLEE